MTDAGSDSVIEAAAIVGGNNGAAIGPTLTLRPRLVFRLLGPALIVVGGVGIAAGALPAAIAGVVGLLLLVTWLPRLTVNDHEITVRGVTSTATIPLASIDEVRLRRVPYGPRHVLRRTFRLGPFSTTPIRLRFIRADVTLNQITVAYWENWAGLVRYLLSIPTITSDSRTRGRLDRYG